MIFADATHSGVIEEQERAILSGIMKLAEKPVRELMTPRTEIDWIDSEAGEEAMLAVIAETPHSMLPVAEASPEKVLGVVKVREILALQVAGEPIVLAELIRK